MLDGVIARPGGIDGPDLADEVRAAIERYRDAVNRHDIDAVVAAFTDDGLIDCTPPPDGERYEGAVGISRCSGFSGSPQTNGPSRPRN
jgi:hypothetical protein